MVCLSLPEQFTQTLRSWVHPARPRSSASQSVPDASSGQSAWGPAADTVTFSRNLPKPAENIRLTTDAYPANDPNAAFYKQVFNESKTAFRNLLKAQPEDTLVRAARMMEAEIRTIDAKNTLETMQLSGDANAILAAQAQLSERVAERKTLRQLICSEDPFMASLHRLGNDAGQQPGLFVRLVRTTLDDSQPALRKTSAWVIKNAYFDALREILPQQEVKTGNALLRLNTPPIEFRQPPVWPVKTAVKASNDDIYWVQNIVNSLSAGVATDLIQTSARTLLV